MKKTTIAIIICNLFLISCNQVTKKTKTITEIGINQQLLDAVDSKPYCRSKDSFITIWFTNDTCSKIIIIKNRMMIPISPEPPQPYKQILISEWDMFIGYKKYKNRTLVFLNSLDNNTYSNFLNKDSLKFDETPFKESNLYGDFQDPIHDKIIQKIFRITGKDSLIMLDKKDWPFYLR